MDDLIAFIKARLDEDEAAANAGARRVGMPWRAEPQPSTPGGLVLDELGLVGSTGGRYAAEHIARHDPARVLREIEAKRAILAEHRPEEIIDGWSVCYRCTDWTAGSYDGTQEDGDEPEDDQRPMAYPCPTLLRLAYIWADHPDFRAEWKRAHPLYRTEWKPRLRIR